MTTDALSYAVSVACLLLIRGHEPRSGQRPAGARPSRRDVAGGLEFITRHPVLRRTTACAAAGNLFIAMQIALNLLFLVRVLQVRPEWAGLLTALACSGGIIGGMLAAALARRIGPARAMWLCPLVFEAPALLLVPLAEPGWRTALFPLACGLSVFGSAIFSASQIAHRQSVCPAELRGRMNAASRCIIWGTLPFGGVLGGVLGTAVGIRLSVWIAYAGLWTAGFLIFFSPLRHVRDFGDPGAEVRW